MRVVNVVVIRDGRVLIQHRKRRQGFVYEFPCGKVEDGETFEMAAMRELAEETGLAAQVTELPVFTSTDDLGDIAFVPLSVDTASTPRMTSPEREQTFHWMRPEDVPIDVLYNPGRSLVKEVLRSWLDLW